MNGVVLGLYRHVRSQNDIAFGLGCEKIMKMPFIKLTGKARLWVVNKSTTCTLGLVEIGHIFLPGLYSTGTFYGL